MLSIIEDDDAARESLYIFLECAGMACRSFDSCESFLAVGPDVEDCLILDIDMPGMSGLELLEYLRGRGESLPVILVTGLSSPDTAERAKAADAVAVLQKPFDPNALLELIQSAQGH